jgi:hypothetical protein
MTAVKTAKYPGWTIEKETIAGRTEYLMTRQAGRYAIGVSLMGGEWTGEILTKQGRSYVSGRTWEPAINAFSGTVPQCIAEAERRAGIIDRFEPHRTKPWGAEARKLRGDRSREPGTALYPPRFRRTF